MFWATRMKWRISPNIATIGGSTDPRGLWFANTRTHAVPSLSLSMQNCNSLNVSTDCDKQLAKLIAVTTLCTDIIFLSDIRLNDDNVAVDKISKVFLCNNNRNYYFHYNSPYSRRGVGILIACDIPCTIINTYSDPGSNILGLVLETDKYLFSIVSVYGPNDNDKVFYSNISEFISKLVDVPVILGGDWNATYSQSPAHSNIDVVNMLSSPSLIRSGWIADLCCTYNLLDPYRAFHPTLRDFTFFPSGARKNRSRLNFFLTSDNLIQSSKSCKISPWISVANFDHKSVVLDFSKDKTNKKLFMNRSISSNTRTNDVVLGAFANTCLAHADENQVIQDVNVHRLHTYRQLETQKGIVGRFLQLIRDYNDLSERIIKELNNNMIPLQLAGIERDIELQRDLIWSVDKFLQLSLTCDHDFFLEALASNIKGSVISFQTFTNRLKNLKNPV
jgi:exonuclease III